VVWGVWGLGDLRGCQFLAHRLMTDGDSQLAPQPVDLGANRAGHELATCAQLG
jgi:hypothetical protein